MGMKVRVACCSLIYRKTLKLTKTALGETTIGQAVNLLSNDVNRFDISIIFLHYLWLGPLETIIMTYVMYDVIDVGVSSVIGVAFLLMFIPLQGGKVSALIVSDDKSNQTLELKVICMCVFCPQSSEMFKLEVISLTKTIFSLWSKIKKKFL